MIRPIKVTKVFFALACMECCGEPPEARYQWISFSTTWTERCDGCAATRREPMPFTEVWGL